MRYRLRTLLILLAVLPPVLAVLWLSPSRPLVVTTWFALTLLALIVWRAVERLYAA